MNALVAQYAVPNRTPDFSDVAGLVDAIGRKDFGARLVSYLHRCCGADHFAAYRLSQTSLQRISAGSVASERDARDHVDRYVHEEWWRKDPAIEEAKACLAQPSSRLIHVDVGGAGYSALRPTIFPDVRDRVLFFGRHDDRAFGLSVIRTNPHLNFTAGEVEYLSLVGTTLVAIVAKHAEVSLRRPNAAQALTSLAEIEACIDAMTSLPRREREVCARVLFGMYTVGIALDLGVGEESVKTYRKRAYQRIGLGSERELLTWYLALWSRWRDSLN